MFVFYEPETLKILHLVTLAPPDYADFLRTSNEENWFEADFDGDISEMEIMSDMTLRKRQHMSVIYSQPFKVGVESVISNIPNGVTVYINNIGQGVMDQSESLEFTPETGGIYTFRFEGSGFVTKEISIEAVL
jgi:hypothetical protein